MSRCNWFTLVSNGCCRTRTQLAVLVGLGALLHQPLGQGSVLANSTFILPKNRKNPCPEQRWECLLGWISEEKGSEELPLTSSVPLHFTKTRSKVGQGQISEMCQLQHGLMREVPLHLSAPALEIIKGPKWELDIFDSEIL